MKQMQHIARLTALLIAPVSALAFWLWLQPLASANVLASPDQAVHAAVSAGGLPPECVNNPRCGVAGITDEEGEGSENHQIPLVPVAAVYPALAALGFGAARVLRRRGPVA